jgi:murein DD-endopeptidase MepM/ murein hydrolase activator NlpD
MGLKVFIFLPFRQVTMQYFHNMFLRMFGMKTAVVVFFCFAAGFLDAQHADSLFGPPMRIPLVITAGFGEIRPNHFHSGLDFSTAGKPQDVLAAAAGCVSRIKVSVSGYGKALYIDHPEGYTTVYGHLGGFSPDIEAFVLEMQKQTLDYQIDILVDSGRFCFGRGETIAISGNSGSSSAPHLHFEIRDKLQENVFNPLFFGFNSDKTAPEVFSLLLIPRKNLGLVNGSSEILKIPLLKNKAGKRYLSSKIPVPLISGQVALGFEGGDIIGKRGNYSGVYKVRTFVDNREIFRSRVDEFSFDEARAVNAYINYATYKKTKKKFQQCFVPENALIGIYKSAYNRGFYPIEKDTLYTFKLELTDFSGNITEQELKVKGTGLNFSYKYRPPAENHLRIPPAGIIIDKGNFKAIISDRCLYDSSDVKIILRPLAGAFSPLVELGSVYIPLHSSVKLIFKPEIAGNELDKKLCIARKSGTGWDVLSSKWQNNELHASTNLFGDFAVIIDTIAPRITNIPIKKKNPKTRRKEIVPPIKAGEIKLKIVDPISETPSWQAYLDDVFLIPRPAGKDIWTYTIPDNMLSGEHKFIVLARDDYNNESSLTIPLYVP